MYGGPYTYATYREYCENHAPGFVQDSRVDYSDQQTTEDQARLENVLDPLFAAGASLLHVGVGNSKLAQRFSSRTRRIDGLTVSEREQTHAQSLGLRNYTVHVLNKYSRDFGHVFADTYDFIIDNNLASFACCRRHFHVMVASYVGALKPGGAILTDQAGMDWYHGELGWPMTYADLVSLETGFPLRVSRLTATVYALGGLS